MVGTSTRTLRVGLFLIASLGLNAVAGTTDRFYERDSFLAAVAPGYGLADFGSFAEGDPVDNPFVQELSNGSQYSIFADAGLYAGDGWLSTEWIDDDLVIEFSGTPAFAVGGNFWLSDIGPGPAPGTLLIGVDFSDGSSIQETFVDPPEIPFYGVVSTAAITRVTLSLSEGGAYPTLDNLHVGAAAIPAPGAMGLGAVGAGFVAWLRRRRAV